MTIILYLLSASYSFAQLSKIDSLKTVIRTADHSSNGDTTKMKAIGNLAWILHSSNPDTALQLAREEYQLAEKLGDKKYMAHSLRTQGTVHWVKSEYPKAMECYKKAVKIDESIGNKQGMAADYNNIGGIYHNQSSYPKALEYFFKSLKIREELDDNQGMASSYGNIGAIYHNQSSYPEALEYYFKALKIMEELGNKHAASIFYNNIGLIYINQFDYPRALDYYSKSLKIKEELGNKQGMASSYTNIGSLYTARYKKTMGGKTDSGWAPSSLALLDTALIYQQKAYKLNRELNYEYNMVNTLSGIGAIYNLKNDYRSAIEYYQQAALLADSINALNEGSLAHKILAELYEKTNKNKLALEHYKQYTTLKDSVFNEEKSKDIGKLEAEHEYDKQRAVAEAEYQKEFEKQEAIAASESRRQKVIIYAVSGGLGLMLILAFLIYRGYRQKQKANVLLERKNTTITRQKKEIEEKNKDITDSIRYAQNIQKAILPPIEVIKKTLPESFVLFKPKDIVSGDFYFYSKVRRSIILAACDCTGHGVPGAFMSMIGSQLLNEIVNDKSVTDAAEVLNMLRDGIIHALGEAGATGEQKDGMDIALCVFQRNKDNGIVNLQYAGAYNPLYLIRKGELQQIKADKQPVGYHFGKQTPFTNHRIQLHKSDTIYIFSDGYQDQFGGQRGKKFMSKRFRQLLLDIQEMSMDEQKEQLNKTIEDWKGGREQVDDILVIGVRV